MFKKVKKILGIEGVKMELFVPEIVKSKDGVVVGKIKFTSLTDQEIESVTLELVEKFSRGRKNNRLVDEYKLGQILLEEQIKIKAHQIVDLEFELPFVPAKSEMDKIGESNFFMRGIVSLAKKARKVKSEYKIVAEANVKGTHLNPSATQKIVMR